QACVSFREHGDTAAITKPPRDFRLAKSRLVADALFPRRQSRELCRRVVLRFKRRIGPWCSVPANPIRSSPPSRHFQDFAKRIGRRFTVLFATAVIPPLMRRTWSKGFSL